MFHIIGYDIILDENKKPHLLEINANPSLNVQFEGNEEVKDAIKGVVRPKAKDEPTKGSKKVTAPTKHVSLQKISKRSTSLATRTNTTAEAEDAKEKLNDWKKEKQGHAAVEEDDEEEDEDEDDGKDGKEVKNYKTDDGSLKKREEEYKAFKQQQTDDNEKRKKPQNLDPICLVDLHVKSK